MIKDQSFHRTFKNGTDLYTGFACCFHEHFFIIEGYRIDEMHLLVLVVVLFHIPFQERLETVQYQLTDTGLLQVLCQERRQTGQEPVGERLAVNAVDDFCRCEIELGEKLLFQFGRQLILQNVTYQQLAK